MLSKVHMVLGGLSVQTAPRHLESCRVRTPRREAGEKAGAIETRRTYELYLTGCVQQHLLVSTEHRRKRAGHFADRRIRL